MKNCLVSYEKFINPNNNYEKFINKCLTIDSVYQCSYVVFFIVGYINGEIQDNYFVLSNNLESDIFKNTLYKYYFDEYKIYAINILDNIVCEVI